MRLTFSIWQAIFVFMFCAMAIVWSLPTFLPASSNISWLPKQKVNLGLDLRGGAYLLLEVDVNDFLKEQMRAEAEQFSTNLRKTKIAHTLQKITERDFALQLTQEGDHAEFDKIRHNILSNRFLASEQGDNIVFQISEPELKVLADTLMNRTLEIIRRRVDESGTKEIELQRQGLNQVLLQVPGLENPDEIKQLLGKTAKLSFHLVPQDVSVQEIMRGTVAGLGVRELADKINGQRQLIAIENRAVISGDMLMDAQATMQNNLPVVSFKLNALGAKIFANVSTEHTGQLFAIVLDDKVLSAPVIREPILGGAGIISGNFTMQSANELALLLRAGALPAPIKIAEERVIGPSLGHDSIEAGKQAVLIGMALVMVFMLLFYGWFGMVANVALVMNLFFIIAILAVFSATLTLPGIAGIVLTLGMAVDANVLIFERIKEELHKGKSVLKAISSGFDAAFMTIVDSNLTTVLAAVILYIFGTGSVRGFAVTLSVGILSSMFTAIVLTKLIVSFWYRIKQPNQLQL